MATAASTTTATANEDRTANTSDPAPTTATEGVTSEKLPASSADKEDVDSGDMKSNTTDPVTVTADIENNNEDDASATDIEKKIRRAERFGMPVKLSEEEKRNSRAERFGTAAGTQGSDGTKKADELKRKSRAERFGVPQSTPVEEEEKKKARLSRFGSASSADPKEEEKKKARALRFSGTPVTGNGKIEPKATIAGNAGGDA